MRPLPSCFGHAAAVVVVVAAVAAPDGVVAAAAFVHLKAAYPSTRAFVRQTTVGAGAYHVLASLVAAKE